MIYEAQCHTRGSVRSLRKYYELFGVPRISCCRPVTNIITTNYWELRTSMLAAAHSHWICAATLSGWICRNALECWGKICLVAEAHQHAWWAKVVITY